MSLTFHEGYQPFATMGDAHREWHLNAGVPMGTPGCPQDACHPPDDYDESQSEPWGIKCGNHPRDQKVYHPNAAAVRACYAARYGQTVQAEPAPAPEPTPAPQPVAGPSFGQRAAHWRQIPVGARGYGYYALPGSDGEPNFFRVERPTKGKFAGKTFVKVQAGDAFHQFDREAAYSVMDRIAADVEAAGVLYAQTISKCSRCGRTLTDDDSRALGMGPDCAKAGW